MTVKFAPFDVADYLDNEDVIAEYLSAAAEDPNSEVLLHARADVAKARVIAQSAWRGDRPRSTRAFPSRPLSAEPLFSVGDQHHNLDADRESPSHSRPDHTARIVNSILILTIIVQIIMVKFIWT
jgi:hypothetical protein